MLGKRRKPDDALLNINFLTFLLNLLSFVGCGKNPPLVTYNYDGKPQLVSSHFNFRNKEMLTGASSPALAKSFFI